MPTRPCIDCRTPTEGTRCPACRRERERQRGSRQDRGYDAEHDQATRDPAYLAATHCVTCERPFTEANPKTAGHTTALRHDRTARVVIPQCASCNYGWRRTGH